MQTVLNAVNAVTVLLNTIGRGGSTQANNTNTVAAAQARFRETMEEASSQVHDPELMRYADARCFYCVFIITLQCGQLLLAWRF